MRRTCAALALALAATTAVVLGSSPAGAVDPDQLGPDDVVRDVAMPSVATYTYGVRRDGERVVGVFRVDGHEQVLEDDLSAGTGWQSVPGQEVRGPLASPMEVTGAAHGVTVVAQPISSSQFDNVVTGPGGSWEMVSTGAASLDSSGAYVVVPGAQGAVYAADGSHVVDVDPTKAAALDDGQLWTVGADGVIARLDLADVAADPDAAPVPVTRTTSCRAAPAQLEVRGRWAAVLACTSESDASRRESRLVDLEGRLSPLTRDDTRWQLTPGALTFDTYPALVVDETAAEGPIRRLAVASGSLRADDTGSDFSYLDPHRGIHLLDLSLSAPAVDDVTPPVASFTSAAPAEWVRLGGTVRLAWAGTDPAGDEGPGSGTYRYEVNLSHTRDVEPGSRTTLAIDAGATSFAATAAFLPLECYRVRAVDRRENVGAWSDPQCVKVDVNLPEVRDSGRPISFAPVAGTKGVDVGYRFATHDDESGVASYEARFRRSTQSSTTYTGWSSVTSPTDPLSVSVHAGDRLCLQGRAVDKVGWVGLWTDTVTCTAAPYDDALLALHGVSSTFHSSSAYAGTARTLVGSSSLKVVSGSSLNCVSVRALGAFGTRAGTLQVLINGTSRGRIVNQHPLRAWEDFTSADGRALCGKGVVELRHVPGTPAVTVDAVGLYRSGDKGYHLNAP